MPRGKASPAMATGSKCSCNPGWMILSAIVMAIGALLLVQGFVIQLQGQGTWDMGSMSWVLGYYFVGILIFGAGKAMKCKACESCMPHSRGK